MPGQLKTTTPAGSDTMYRRVELAILAEIREGKLKPGDRLGGTENLAAKWKVSPSTIRQSLQMLASMGVVIRKPRVGTVVAPQADQPMVPDILPPRPRATAASRMIALLLPDITHPEFARLARAFQDVADRSDMDVVIASTDGEIERYEEIIQRQIKHDIFGIVMVPPATESISLDLAEEMHRRKIPGVALFRDIPATGWPVVCTDYFHNKYILAKHLCDIGCQQIAFFIKEEAGDRQHVKHYAFLRALMAAGRPIRDDMFLILPRQRLKAVPTVAEEYEERVITWLRAHPEVDGICCAHDEDAFVVIEILKKLGRRVPQDVAVGGEGGFAPYLGHRARTLTTVDMPDTEMAEQTCDLIRAMREGERVTATMPIAIKGQLIVGQSTLRE